MIDPETLAYYMVPSPFGTLGVLWYRPEGDPKVLRLVLPGVPKSVEDRIRSAHPGIHPRSCRRMRRLGEDLKAFLHGSHVRFSLEALDLDQCGPFQQRVLRAEHRIPRGRVATYGGIARHLGIPRAARAVGRGLATNPFPIIVPCHRAVRSDGALGGFQGGLAMKRALLEMEGLQFTKTGKVLLDRIYY